MNEALKVQITEGIEGSWHYHLSIPGTLSVSLCGARTMSCNLNKETWGFVGHLNERFCEECLRVTWHRCITCNDWREFADEDKKPKGQCLRKKEDKGRDGFCINHSELVVVDD